ncbi:phosphotransferase [Trueperella sp. LYQ143]|uniref:phosphotransferase n=1 Tax=unclassified Trueperella TaxID=2630174 RepID=UPI003982F5A3
MDNTPFKLAALAVTAIDGLNAVGVRGPYTRTADFQYGTVIDDRGRPWIVKYPLHAIAATMIEAEASVAPYLLNALRDGHLPFDVMRPSGFAQAKHGRAVVYMEPLGRQTEFDVLDLAGAGELGRALAAIHRLPHSIVENAGLPSYDAQTCRRRLLSELHDAAASAAIPGVLRRRWENALEVTDMWDFEPCVVHGDIGSDQFTWSDGSISCVLGFGSAHVGDPASDFAALISGMDETLFDAVISSYTNALDRNLDENFFNRAVLLSELALAKWLMFGVRRSDPDIIDDAVNMMNDLAADVEADPELAPGPTWSVSSIDPHTNMGYAEDAGFTSDTGFVSDTGFASNAGFATEADFASGSYGENSDYTYRNDEEEHPAS